MNLQVQEARQAQEFTFGANAQDVLDLFTGKERHRTENVDYGGDTVEVGMYAGQTNVGTWVVTFLVAFQNPEIIVSANSKTMRVAMIELEQREVNECRAILHFLADTYQVRPDLKADRALRYYQGQDIVAGIWLRKKDEWSKQAALTEPTKSAAQEQDATPGKSSTPLQKKILEAVQALKPDYADPPDEEVAAKVGLNQRGQPYTRETINRERSKMRRLKIDV